MPCGSIRRRPFHHRASQQLIEDAEICIFDLTAERPNVYHELGWADGADHSSDRMILIAKKGTQLHFDLSHRSVRFFSDTEHLRTILSEDLEAMLSYEEEEEEDVEQDDGYDQDEDDDDVDIDIDEDDE